MSEKPLDLDHACASLRSGQQLHKLSVVLHYTLTQPDLQQETQPRVSDGGYQGHGTITAVIQWDYT